MFWYDRIRRDRADMFCTGGENLCSLASSPMCRFEHQSIKITLSYWGASKGGPRGLWRVWRGSFMRSSWVCSAWRKLRGHLIAHPHERKQGGRYWSLHSGDQGNSLKLSQGKFRLAIRKRYFIQRMVGTGTGSPGKWSLLQAWVQKMFGQCSQVHGVTLGDGAVQDQDGSSFVA